MTLVILFPWITTTASRTGVPPLPSISVPPSMTSAGASCARADRRLPKNARRKNNGKRRHKLQLDFVIASPKWLDCTPFRGEWNDRYE